jgi:hypothetical protein
MRIRTIKPEFYRSEDIAALPRDVRLLFIGLWSYVDDNGVGIDDYRQIAADLFALEEDPKETRDWVRESLATLSRVSLTVHYKINGRAYLFIPSWDRHQKIDKPGKARYPRPPADYTPPTSDNDPGGGQLATPSRDLRETPGPGTGEQGNRGTEKNPSCALPDDANFLITADAVTGGGIEAEFETWWAQWPRKIAKKDALAAYKRARKKKITAARLLGTAAAQIEAWRAAGREQDKIPHATTWLNQERWNDIIEQPKFKVINNPDSPWDGYRIDASDSPWAADMGWTS